MNRLEIVANPQWLKRFVCACQDRFSKNHRSLTRAIENDVLVLTCDRCQTKVARLNPRTCIVELLHGESPWTKEDAEVIEATPRASPGLERIAQEIAEKTWDIKVQKIALSPFRNEFLASVAPMMLAILSRSMEGRGGELDE